MAHQSPLIMPTSWGKALEDAQHPPMPVCLPVVKHYSRENKPERLHTTTTCKTQSGVRTECSVVFYTYDQCSLCLNQKTYSPALVPLPVG